MKKNSEPDPLAEAKVYLAYGRNQQAVELLEKAIAVAPSRTDLQDLLVQARAKGKSWSPLRNRAELAASTLAFVGIMLVAGFDTWSAESIIGWICIIGPAAYALIRLKQS